MIVGIHHFALTVADVDRSVAFYREFGLEVVSDREVEGGYVEQISGIPGAHLRITHLSGFGHNLELLEYRSAARRPCPGTCLTWAAPTSASSPTTSTRNAVDCASAACRSGRPDR